MLPRELTAWQIFLSLKQMWDADRLSCIGKPVVLVAAEGTAAFAADDAPGAVQAPPPAPTTAPGAPLTDALRDELIDAVRRADAPARAQIAAQWPVGVPTFKQSAEHTREQLRAIQRVVLDVCGFTGGTDVAVPTVDQLTGRLRALPGDLLAAVEATAKGEGCPNLKTHGIEARWLMRVDALCREAEHEHARRVQEVDEALADLDDDIASDLLRTVTGGLVPAEALLALQAEQVVCLAAAATWLLDADLTVNPQAWAELVDRRGGKRAVLDVAKTIANRHGLTAPKSSDIGDPVLAALVAGA